MIVDLKSPSLEEMVYSRLEEEILSGDLATGCALGEIALAKRLGVSRTPIRSAIHRLAEESKAGKSIRSAVTAVLCGWRSATQALRA